MALKIPEVTLASLSPSRPDCASRATPANTSNARTGAAICHTLCHRSRALRNNLASQFYV
jgi:hypothetical protein